MAKKAERLRGFRSVHRLGFELREKKRRYNSLLKKNQMFTERKSLFENLYFLYTAKFALGKRKWKDKFISRKTFSKVNKAKFL